VARSSVPLPVNLGCRFILLVGGGLLGACDADTVGLREPAERTTMSAKEAGLALRCRRLAVALDVTSSVFRASPPMEHCSQSAVAKVGNGVLKVTVCSSRNGRRVYSELGEGDTPVAFSIPNLAFRGYRRVSPDRSGGIWGALEVEKFSKEGVYDLVYFDFEGMRLTDLETLVEQVLSGQDKSYPEPHQGESSRCRRGAPGLREGDIRRGLFE